MRIQTETRLLRDDCRLSLRCGNEPLNLKPSVRFQAPRIGNRLGLACNLTEHPSKILRQSLPFVYFDTQTIHKWFESAWRKSALIGTL